MPQVVHIINDSYESREQLGEESSHRFYKTIVRAKANFTTPAILHVSKESRVVGLRAWSLEFGPQLRHPVYFSWNRDTLFMDTFNALLAFYGGPWTYNTSFGNEMSNVEKNLRRLVIGEQIPRGFVPAKIISRLYNLERLTLPRLYGRGFAANKAQVELAEKIRGWMTEKQDLYSKQEGIYKDWMLPDIDFMPKKELAALDGIVSRGSSFSFVCWGYDKLTIWARLRNISRSRHSRNLLEATKPKARMRMNGCRLRPVGSMRVGKPNCKYFPPWVEV